MAVVVAACGGGGPTALDDALLSDLNHPKLIGGSLAFAHKTDALNGVGGVDNLTFDGNATFAPDKDAGFPVTYRLVSGTGNMAGKVVRSKGDTVCTYEGGRSVQLVPGDGAFTISRDPQDNLRYSGHIKLKVTYPVKPKCKAGRTQVTLPEELLEREMDLMMEGTYGDGTITNITVAGVMKPYDIGPIHCTGSWNMFAVK
jgi:hypothetical protein